MSTTRSTTRPKKTAYTDVGFCALNLYYKGDMKKAKIVYCAVIKNTIT